MIDFLAADRLRGLISRWIEQQNASFAQSSDRQCDQVLKRLAELEKRFLQVDSRLARLERGEQQHLQSMPSIFGP